MDLNQFANAHLLKIAHANYSTHICNYNLLPKTKTKNMQTIIIHIQA